MFNSQSFRRLTSFRSFLHQHGCISKGRESSSHANQPRIRSYRSRTEDRSYEIVTLDPTKLVEKKQKRFCIAHSYSFSPHVVLQEQSSSDMKTTLRYYHILKAGVKVPLPFPSDADGFLYYTTSNPGPKKGEIRFRTTSSNDPASFASGSDLFFGNRPWTRPLSILPIHHPLLYQKIKEEAFISAGMDAALSHLPKFRFRGTQYLYSLNDTFILNFGFSRLTLSVVTTQGNGTIELFGHFLDRRERRIVRPYTGSAFARFERSTNPDHQDTRNVVLRFLEVIEPVKCVIPLYDGYITRPKRGKLYRRYFSTDTIARSGPPPVWDFLIDPRMEDENSRGFRLLWEV